MCLPLAVVAAVGLGITAVGGIVSAVGQYKAGENRRDYNNYLANTTEEQIGEVQKSGNLQRRMIMEGYSRTSQKAAKTSQTTLGAQRAAAAENVGGGSVTTENIAIDEAMKSTLDDMYIRVEAENKRKESQTEEEGMIAELHRKANAYRTAGALDQEAAGWNVAGSLLSTAGQVASGWTNWSRTQEGKNA